MPVRKRNLTRRAALSENARAWLDGKPCGFFKFKPRDELVALWERYGDPEVATWDLGTHSKPVAIAN